MAADYNKLGVHLVGTWITPKEHPLSDEYFLPDQMVEMYAVTYLYPEVGERSIAKFYISNATSDSLELLTPLDIGIVDWILEQMYSRSLKRDWAGELNTGVEK